MEQQQRAPMFAPMKNPNQQLGIILFGTSVVSIFFGLGLFGIFLAIFAMAYWIIGEIRMHSQMILLEISGNPGKYLNTQPVSSSQGQGYQSLEDPSK